MTARRCGFMPWSDGSRHITQFWEDTDTGRHWSTQPPCGSPSCYRAACRQAYHDDLLRAIGTVAAHYRYSTLVTVPRLSLSQAHEVEKALMRDVRAAFNGKAAVFSVVEPHKAGWGNASAEHGFHVHAVVLHNHRPPRNARWTFAGGREFDHPTVRTTSPKFKPYYLLKEYRDWYREHLARNGGKVYRSSAGFFRVPVTQGARNARQAAARHAAGRTRAVGQLCRLVPNVADFLSANPWMSGEDLILKAEGLARAAKAVKLVATRHRNRQATGCPTGVRHTPAPAPRPLDLFEALNIPMPHRPPMRT